MVQTHAAVLLSRTCLVVYSGVETYNRLSLSGFPNYPNLQ